MPAPKPSALNKRHDTNSDREAREQAEAAMTPRTKLSPAPPVQLRGRKKASEIWVEIMGLYQEVTGQIVTAFDADLLIKYCIIEEELSELEQLRNDVMKLWTKHVKKLEGMKRIKYKDMKAYYDALNSANSLLKRYQGLDARLDGKRKLRFTYSQSLYLTPRSRAGVAPEERVPQKPKSKMGDLLDGKEKASPG
jgi:hypothetical protein